MIEASERLAAVCPACSPGGETVHQVLSPGGQATVRCSECGHVHKVSTPEQKTVELDVIVSQDGESFAATVDVPTEERLRTGEEFVLETPEAIMAVRITDLQLDDEQRTEAAPADSVRTIWTRAVDNVRVDVTIHPSDGSNDETRSRTIAVPGEQEFTVGEIEDHGSESFKIEGLHVREDAVGYPTNKLDEYGDRVPAKDIKRIYARDQSTDAWSAW